MVVMWASAPSLPQERAESVGTAAGSYSLAGSECAASPAASDLFSSPYLASQATLTVDYRQLHGAVLVGVASKLMLHRCRSPFRVVHMAGRSSACT